MKRRNMFTAILAAIGFGAARLKAQSPAQFARGEYVFIKGIDHEPFRIAETDARGIVIGPLMGVLIVPTANLDVLETPDERRKRAAAR